MPVGTKNRSPAKRTSPLNQRQLAFCREYAVDLNATQAAIRAGYSKRTAGAQGTALLQNQEIQLECNKYISQKAKDAGLNAAKVIEELWNMATTDANELTEYRRHCCRYCYGENHDYQRTPKERREAWALYQNAVANHKGKGPIPEFDERGGLGYNPHRPPVEDCPECFGQGVGEVFIKDTRKVSKAAKSLFAGVKQTKEGVEIKTHSKEKSLELLGRHLQLFKDHLQLDANTNHSGQVNIKIEEFAVIGRKIANEI